MLQRVAEYLLVFRAAVINTDSIIDQYLLILQIHDRRNGMIQPEACQQQCRTAADADHGHQHSCTVPEEIADRDLCMEAELPPEPFAFFEQDALAVLRCLRAHQLRGHFLHDRRTDCSCRHAGADQCGRQTNQRIAPVIRAVDLRIMIHHLITSEQHPREQLVADHRTDRRSEHTGQHRIQQILRRDRQAGVAECLAGSDLGALLLDHARDGRQADQRSNKQEEHREDPCDAVNTIGVVAVAAPAGIFAAVKRIPFDLRADIVQCFQSFLIFLLALFQRFLCILQTNPLDLLGLFQIGLFSGKLQLGICQLLFLLVQFILILDDILIALHQLVHRRFKLLAADRKLLRITFDINDLVLDIDLAVAQVPVDRILVVHLFEVVIAVNRCFEKIEHRLRNIKFLRIVFCHFVDEILKLCRIRRDDRRIPVAVYHAEHIIKAVNLFAQRIQRTVCLLFLCVDRFLLLLDQRGIFFIVRSLFLVFLPLLVELFAAGFQIILSLFQFSLAVSDGLFQFLQTLLVLLFAFVKFSADIRKLLLDRLAHLFGARRTELFLIGKDRIGAVIDDRQIPLLKAADLRSVSEPQPDVRIDIGFKCFRRHKQKAVDPAVADCRRSALKIHVDRKSVRSADNGKLLLLQKRLRAVGRNSLYPVADSDLCGRIHLDQTFIGLFRHSAFCQHRLIDLLPFLFSVRRQTVDLHRHICGII